MIDLLAEPGDTVSVAISSVGSIENRVIRRWDCEFLSVAYKVPSTLILKDPLSCLHCKSDVECLQYFQRFAPHRRCRAVEFSPLHTSHHRDPVCIMLSVPDTVPSTSSVWNAFSGLYRTIEMQFVKCLLFHQLRMHHQRHRMWDLFPSFDSSSVPTSAITHGLKRLGLKSEIRFTRSGWHISEADRSR